MSAFDNYGMPNQYGTPGSFGFGYQAPSFTPFNAQQQPPQQSQEPPEGFQGITLVHNRDEVVASMVPLNSRVLLMDADEPRFWVKTVSASGLATIEEFKFKAVEKKVVNPDEYALSEEVNQLRKELAELKQKYEAKENHGESDIREEEQVPTVKAEPIDGDDW